MTQVNNHKVEWKGSKWQKRQVELTQRQIKLENELAEIEKDLSENIKEYRKLAWSKEWYEDRYGDEFPENIGEMKGISQHIKAKRIVGEIMKQAGWKE